LFKQKKTISLKSQERGCWCGH